MPVLLRLCGAARPRRRGRPARRSEKCSGSSESPRRPPVAAWASSSRGLLRDFWALNARILLLPRPVVKDYACPYPARCPRRRCRIKDYACPFPAFPRPNLNRVSEAWCPGLCTLQHQKDSTASGLPSLRLLVLFAEGRGSSPESAPLRRHAGGKGWLCCAHPRMCSFLITVFQNHLIFPLWGDGGVNQR